MIPTIIQFVVILLIVAALMPFALVGLAKIPFLHMEVGGYLPSVTYMLTSIVTGVLLTLLLYPLLKRHMPPILLYIIGYACSLLTYYLADLVIESVTIPIYVEMFFALVSNNFSTIDTEQDNEDENQ